MPDTKVATGVAHSVPPDLRAALVADPPALALWNGLTPLARNEWICWTISVKRPDTRQEHVARVVTELNEGMRRPCCWIGCTHRTDKPMSATQKYILGKQAKKERA